MGGGVFDLTIIVRDCEAMFAMCLGTRALARLVGGLGTLPDLALVSIYTGKGTVTRTAFSSEQT